MQVGLDAMMASMGRKQLIVPYLEAMMASPKWPRLKGLDLHERPRSGLDYFHPSTHPLMSERELYYRFHPEYRHLVEEEEPSRRQRFTFDVGAVVGALIEQYLVQVGLVASDDDLEVRFADHEHRVSGRADAIITHPTEGRIVVEVKTQNAKSYAVQRAIKASWEAQLQLTMAGLGMDRGILLLCELGYPYDMKEFPQEANPALVSRLHDKFDRVMQAIATNTPPADCCKRGTAVKRCAARNLCFPQEAL